MSYIQDNIKYSSYYKSERDFLQNLFCVLGNGYSINLKGHIQSYSWAEFVITEEVQPLTYIYPCNSINAHMRLAGCSNPGFKEAVQYLIDCILITPDTVLNITEWKENINRLEELRDYPTIQDPYENLEQAEIQFKKDLEASKDTTATRCNIHEEPKNSVSKVYFFDIQWSDCPIFVYEEVKQIWTDHELGNDHYVYKTTLDIELFESYPRVYSWLKHKSVEEDAQVLIHWWW